MMEENDRRFVAFCTKWALIILASFAAIFFAEYLKATDAKADGVTTVTEVSSSEEDVKDLVIEEDDEAEVNTDTTDADADNSDTDLDSDTDVEEKTTDQLIAECDEQIEGYRRSSMENCWLTLFYEKEASYYEVLKFELEHPDMTEEDQADYNDLIARYEMRFQALTSFEENYPESAPSPAPKSSAASGPVD